MSCNKEGRVTKLLGKIQMLYDWMKRVGTHNTLRRCLAKYARKRGNETMSQIAWGESSKFRRLAKSMDQIGWRRYMEGTGLIHYFAVYIFLRVKNGFLLVNRESRERGIIVDT
jgi:hypothetical protein